MKLRQIVTAMEDLRSDIRRQTALLLRLLQYFERTVNVEQLSQERRILLSMLPSHLLRTYFALETLKEASASQVSEITKRARAVESSYLNQLVRMGIIDSEKRGSFKVFMLKSNTLKKVES